MHAQPVTLCSGTDGAWGAGRDALSRHVHANLVHGHRVHVEALDLVAVEVEDVNEPVLRADDEELLMGADAADAVAREHLGHVEADAAVLEQRLDLIIVVDIWLRLRHPGPEPPPPPHARPQQRSLYIRSEPRRLVRRAKKTRQGIAPLRPAAASVAFILV